MAFTQDPEPWVAAGGDRHRLATLSRAGKVATFTDGDARVLAAIHPDRPHTGTLGDWVGGPDVLEAGRSWLAAQGCRAAEGPALLAPWFPAGASLGPFEIPPFPGEPTEAAARWLEAGYARVSGWDAVVSPHDAPISLGMEKAGVLSSRGWTLGSFETGPASQLSDEAYEKAVEVVHALAEASFGDGPGYLPVDRSVVADFYRPWKAVLDPRLSLVARDPRGTPRGFLLGLPGPTGGRLRAFQILTLGVHRDVRSAGVATWLVAAAHQAARRAGYAAGIHHVHHRPDAQSGARVWGGGEIVRSYGVFRRTW